LRLDGGKSTLQLRELQSWSDLSRIAEHRYGTMLEELNGDRNSFASMIASLLATGW